MSRLLSGPRTVLAYLVLVVLTTGFGIYVIVVSAFKPDARHFQRIIRAWSKAFLAVAGVRYEIHGGQSIDKTKSYVFVANHESNLDVMICFLAIPVPIRYLAKKELFKIPLLARAMRGIGIVETDRDAGTTAHREINRQVARTLELGNSLIIYPEGTRSREGGLGNPKKGAFRIASTAGLPVVPLAIYGTNRLWPPGGRIIRSGKVTVELGDPIPSDAGADVTRDKAWAFVVEAFDRMSRSTG